MNQHQFKLLTVLVHNKFYTQMFLTGDTSEQARISCAKNIAESLNCNSTCATLLG